MWSVEFQRQNGCGADSPEIVGFIGSCRAGGSNPPLFLFIRDCANLLVLVEEVRKCVVDVVTNLRPPVYIALCFEEVQIAL